MEPNEIASQIYSTIYYRVTDILPLYIETFGWINDTRELLLFHSNSNCLKEHNNFVTSDVSIRRESLFITKDNIKYERTFISIYEFLSYLNCRPSKKIDRSIFNQYYKVYRMQNIK